MALEAILIIIVIGAVDHEVLRAEALAIHIDLNALLGIFACCMLP